MNDGEIFHGEMKLRIVVVVYCHCHSCSYRNSSPEEESKVKKAERVGNKVGKKRKRISQPQGDVSV